LKYSLITFFSFFHSDGQEKTMIKVLITLFFAFILFSCTYTSEPNAINTPYIFAYIAYDGTNSFDDDSTDIFISDKDGSHIKKLTETSGNYFNLTSSPDGSSLVYSTRMESGIDLFQINIGDETISNITNMSGHLDDFAEFTPDGNAIVFISTRVTGNYQIHVMDQSNYQIHPVIQPEIIIYPEFEISPDSKYVLYFKRETIPRFHTNILRNRLDNSETVMLTNDSSLVNSNPIYTPDGLYIYFNKKDLAGRTALFRMNNDGNEIELFSDFQHNTQYNNLSITHDSKYLLFFGELISSDYLFRMDIENCSIFSITGEKNRVADFNLASNNDIVYIRFDYDSQEYKLFYTDIEGSITQEVKKPREFIRNPIFINDGF